LFVRCPQFESGALADFYRQAIDAIRSAGAGQVIFPEGVADSAMEPPVLPAFSGPQTAFNFHFYCAQTQLSALEVPVGAPSPEADSCAQIEQSGVGRFTNHADELGVPGFLSEFSCNDVNPDNAQGRRPRCPDVHLVDGMGLLSEEPRIRLRGPGAATRGWHPIERQARQARCFRRALRRERARLNRRVARRAVSDTVRPDGGCPTLTRASCPDARSLTKTSGWVASIKHGSDVMPTIGHRSDHRFGPPPAIRRPVTAGLDQPAAILVGAFAPAVYTADFGRTWLPM
jgi:hypothetical protein